MDRKNAGVQGAGPGTPAVKSQNQKIFYFFKFTICLRS